jgi:hypothetical protein
MFKNFQNHEAAQAFPKCQKIPNIGIFPKVTKNFWAEMKEETFNLDNFPWQTKISKNCPKIQNCFFWESIPGKKFSQICPTVSNP